MRFIMGVGLVLINKPLTRREDRRIFLKLRNEDLIIQYELLMGDLKNAVGQVRAKRSGFEEPE